MAPGDALPREIMKTLLDKEELQWDKLADSEYGGLWRKEGSLETWSWSLNVPVLSSLSDDEEVTWRHCLTDKIFFSMSNLETK